MNQLNFDINFFVDNIWQKKPIVIKKGIRNFNDPISPEELAGLAMESDVASRVVVTKGDDWEIVHGPFEDYETFGEQGWQLLVQAANHWHEASTNFTEAFRFLPDWRFDDLMVSFAAVNGGVGPHIDNYDVFIIQGSGKRHWKVGNKGKHKPRHNDPQSALVEDFTPIIDETLEPGDILYIPPGFPHSGTTLENSMSYSLGYRAPSQQELFNDLADFLMDNELGKQRYESTIKATGKGAVGRSEQVDLMQLISDFVNTPENHQAALGTLLSKNRFELDISPDDSIEAEDIISSINDGCDFTRIGGLKVLCLEQDCQRRLFVDGESYSFNQTSEEILAYLSDHLVLENDWLKEQVKDNELLDFLTQMFQLGYVYVQE
ncbi:cupin [Shewanella sp. OPT22]|nr:cupin [Shewanella sp. OPT22]